MGGLEPSWRLRLLVVLMRRFARPHIARTKTPERASRDFNRTARAFRRPPFVHHLRRPLGGVPAHWIGVGPMAPRRALLWFHGGAYVSGSGLTHLPLLARLSALSGVEAVAPDYRLAQAAPFPAAFEDAEAAWDGLMSLGYRPRGVVLGGDSAGGGLALALLARVLARGERPAGLVALSPWCDLTLQGESIARHGPRDPLIPTAKMAEVVDRYLAGADPCDPRASPVFADFSGAPPALIQVGGGEALLSDAERVAARIEAGGGRVTLDVWPGAPHVWHVLDGWVPEARAALTRAAAFVQTSLESASR